MLFDELDIAASPRELIAVGGVIEPGTLRAAYRNGVFPWPPSQDQAAAHERSVRRLVRRGEIPVLPGTPPGRLVPWVSPHPRAILITHQLTTSRSLRQLMARCGWETTVDRAFGEVLERCATRAEGTWITPAMKAGYLELHRSGGAHSVEVWEGEQLVGGLYGVLTGRVFSGESMFYGRSGASKVALVDLCARLAEVGVALLDTQQESEHLLALGQVLVGRPDYVLAVRSLCRERVSIPDDRRSVRRL